jgi:hypothetical protein
MTGGAHLVTFTIASLVESEEHLHAILNMSALEVEVGIPLMVDRRWHEALHTSRPSPQDIEPPLSQALHSGAIYRAPS